MTKTCLPLNFHGNIDVRKGLPPGIVYVETEEEEMCALAGIPIAPALIGFEEIRGFRGRVTVPLFATRRVTTAEWRQLLAEWKETAAAVPALAQHAAGKKMVADRKAAVRERAAQKASATRLRRTKLARTAYGRLLRELEIAQDASNRAKLRKANGKRLPEFELTSGGLYTRANYRRSRDARARDYDDKSTAISRAELLANEAGINFGWCYDDQADMFVAYFDLPTGQVSFHAPDRGCGPEYLGIWDGEKSRSQERIQCAIENLLSSTALAGKS